MKPILRTILVVLLETIGTTKVETSGASSPQGSKCPICQAIFFDASGIPFAESILNEINKIPGLQQPGCADGSGSGIKQLTCVHPNNGSTTVNRSVFYNGKVGMTFFGFRFDVNLKLRDCIDVDPTLSLGCHKLTKLLPGEEQFLSNLAQIFSSSLVDYMGVRCLSNGGNITNISFMAICLSFILNVVMSK